MIARAILTGLLVAAPAASLGAEPTARRAAPTLGARLDRFYARAAGYRRVKREVLAWHGTTRNGCVAFVSTALRDVGVDIPEDRVRDGYGVSRITFALSGYLEEELGWQRVIALADLRAGDVVFTTGWPDHVFVFHDWRSRRRAIARVIDNQGFLARRALAPPAGSDDAPFNYALRAPAEAAPAE
jgi:hypothetical protein